VEIQQPFTYTLVTLKYGTISNTNHPSADSNMVRHVNHPVFKFFRKRKRSAPTNCIRVSHKML